MSTYSSYKARKRLVDRYAKSPFRTGWWTDAHDQVLADLITTWQWVWELKLPEPLVEMTPTASLSRWEHSDPICKLWGHHNSVRDLGIARAQVLGLTTRIRPAVTMVCKLCGGQFADQSLPASVVERFGIDRLVFCAPCINATLFFDGLPTPSRNDILSFVRALTDLAGRVPPQGLGTGVSDLVGLDDEARERILRLLKTSPSKLAIDRNYGSWFDALVEAGVLEDGARRNSRGIQCQAKDGHVCFSLGEKTIDDLLCSMGVAHIKEPMYPASKFRADFEVDGVFIEYFGLSGDPEYDKKTEAKLALAQKHGIQLIALYPRDLASMSELSKKLSALHCRDIDTPRSSL